MTIKAPTKVDYTLVGYTRDDKRIYERGFDFDVDDLSSQVTKTSTAIFSKVPHVEYILVYNTEVLINSSDPAPVRVDTRPSLLNERPWSVTESLALGLARLLYTHGGQEWHNAEAIHRSAARYWRGLTLGQTKGLLELMRRRGQLTMRIDEHATSLYRLFETDVRPNV